MLGLEELFVAIASDQPVLQGLMAGLIITLFNTFGALAVLLWRNPSQKIIDTALGFAAGVMLTASFTSLILPGIDVGGVYTVITGLAFGALVMGFADRWTPHLHLLKGPEGPSNKRIQGVWLFIIAITLHNMPEGLAVGVGFGSGDLNNAIKLMLAIGIQNIPEGLAVAVSAVSVGFGSFYYASFVGIRAGLVEIPLAVFGAFAVQLAEPLMPYAMGFAAGAMLYVISHEILPETHRQGHEKLATLGFIIGLIVMLYLDITLS